MYNEKKDNAVMDLEAPDYDFWFLQKYSDLNSILSCHNLVYYYPSRLYFYQTIFFGIMTNIINTSG